MVVPNRLSDLGRTRPLPHLPLTDPLSEPWPDLSCPISLGTMELHWLLSHCAAVLSYICEPTRTADQCTSSSGSDCPFIIIIARIARTHITTTSTAGDMQLAHKHTYIAEEDKINTPPPPQQKACSSQLGPRPHDTQQDSQRPASSHWGSERTSGGAGEAPGEGRLGWGIKPL